MAIPKDKIKEIVFSNYEKYIRIASDGYGYVKKIGLHPDELVNEAIIGIIDTHIQFEDTKQIDDFILRAIDSCAFVEKQSLKKIGGEYFQEEVANQGLSQQAFEYADSIYAERASEIYDTFFNYRFPQGMECARCGGKRLTPTNPGFYQCYLCMFVTSLRNATYLKWTKLELSKIYRIVVLVCENELISERTICKLVGIQSLYLITARKYKQLILSIIALCESKDPNDVIKKMLSNRFVEGDKYVGKKFVQEKFLSLNQTAELRKDFLDGISIDDICLKYKKTPNTVNLILAGRQNIIGVDRTLTINCATEYRNYKTKPKPYTDRPLLRIAASLKKINKIRDYYFDRK